MEDQQIKIKTLSNMLWRFAERCGAQGVTFIVSVILARLLTPTEYGTVALITVFTTVFQVFVDSGMGSALVQKLDADSLDFSTVFYFNVVMCIVVYAVLYAAAPWIADFYGDPSLTSMTRVVGLTIVISGVKNIQQSYVSKYLLFKKFFFSTLAGTLIAGVVGITMAYLGFGAWAIVAQQIANTLIDTIILYATVKWRPTKQFSFSRLKALFSFGWKLLVSSLLDTLYNNLRQLIIGKVYSSEDLAFYNRGKQIPNVVVNNINNSIDSVLLPVMSSEQKHAERVKNMTRRAIKTSIYIMAPMTMGIAFVATPLVRLLLTEKWLPCIPYLRIFCITYMFYPIHTANLNAIKAMGRSDLFLKLEIIKKVYGLVLVLITVPFGVMVMAYSLIVSSVVSQIVNSWPNRKLLNYKYSDQLKDILPSIVLAVFMGICTLPVTLLGLPDIWTLLLQVVVGVVVYVVGSIVFKIDSFYFILDMVKPIVRKRVKK